MVIKSRGIKRLSLLIIIGGALGNLHDRIIYNGVLDFIDFHIESFHWFIFNVADIFIFFGVIILIFIELKDNNIGRNENK